MNPNILKLNNNGLSGLTVINPNYDPNNVNSNFRIDSSQLTAAGGLHPVDQKLEQYTGKSTLSNRLQLGTGNLQGVTPAWQTALTGYSVTPEGGLQAPTTTQIRTETGQVGAGTTTATPGISATGRATSITAPAPAPGAAPAAPGQPLDINRMSGDELKSLATKAGAAGLSLTDYITLVNQNAQPTAAETAAVRAGLGIEKTAEAAYKAPVNLEQEYQKLYKEVGIADIKTKLSEIDTRLETKRSDFLKVEGEIKNNPWLSSASRRGRLANAAELALADIGNDLEARQQALDLYKQGVTDIETRLGHIVTQYGLEKETNVDKLNYLLNEAERQIADKTQENITAGLRNIPAFISGVEAKNLETTQLETPVLRIDEAGNVVKGTEPPKTPTQGEQQGLIFFQRMLDAVNNLDEVENTVAQTGLIGQAQMAAFDSPLLLTKAQERYEQAARAFTEARLRKDSGAAIPPEEYESDRKTYFPQPGDTTETLAQKKQSRQVALNALRVASGNAYWSLYGVSPVEETVTRAMQGETGGGTKATEADRSYVSTLNINK